MLNKELFKEKLDTWYPIIEPLFDNGTMDQIYEKLKFDGERGKKIVPKSDFTYRCFKETPTDKVKVVLLGMCPYHTIIKGTYVADGLALSCSNHKDYLAPSLEKYYEALAIEFPQVDIEKSGDLKYLADQGVLLLNSALTTERDKAGAHQELWFPFTKFLFEEYLGRWDIPVIFLGQEAQKFSKFLSPMQWNFSLEHPSFAARNKVVWTTNGTFKKVNKILKDLGKEEINWVLEEAPF